MINYDSFFDLVDININEIEAAKSYIKLRGLYEHIQMAQFLEPFLHRKPLYCEVATVFRYDKRIRRIIYKYIGFLEEYLRSTLSNNFKEPSDLGIKTSKSLNDYLPTCLFSVLLQILWRTDKSFKKEIFPVDILLLKNLEAINCLRNAVSHNRTLVNYRNFLDVTINGKKCNNSLVENIINLYLHLPKEIGERFKKEINDAKFRGNAHRTNQVSWKLPDFLIIFIS